MSHPAAPALGGSDDRGLHALRHAGVSGGLSRPGLDLLERLRGVRRSLRAARAGDDARARTKTAAVVSRSLGDRGWAYLERRFVSRLLTGQTVLMLGYGAIGRRLAELLAPFNMNVIAVRRQTR